MGFWSSREQYGPSVMNRIRTAPSFVEARAVLDEVYRNTQAKGPSSGTIRKWSKAIAARADALETLSRDGHAE